MHSELHQPSRDAAPHLPGRLPFIHRDFLLNNQPGRQLYHRFAEAQPIIDFHNHLPVRQIAENHEFENLTELWLAPDHYKWRAMRAHGIPERCISGGASPREKFTAWAKTVPYTLRNPLYQWAHLDLARFFGIHEPLDPSTADTIWERAQAQLPRLRVHELIRRQNIRVLCTTDDPADSLDHHHAIAGRGLDFQVLPTYRPDQALRLDQPAAFVAWLERLEKASGCVVRKFDDFLDALKKRHDEFHSAGCRLSDHGLTSCPSAHCTHREAARTFQLARDGKRCSAEEQNGYASFLMLQFGRWNADRGWTMQLHLGALRDTNSRGFRALGRDAGYDSIGDFPQARSLAAFLDALDRTEQLPRTILYNLNPADTYVFASMIGNFQDSFIAGKVQLGSSWWFLDHQEGIETQLNALANVGLLRHFVGMVTDSRSFLSFTRHEYFRRVLCNLLGEGIARGNMPDDLPLVGEMVEEISFANARDYFGFRS